MGQINKLILNIIFLFITILNKFKQFLSLISSLYKCIIYFLSMFISRVLLTRRVIRSPKSRRRRRDDDNDAWYLM